VRRFTYTTLFLSIPLLRASKTTCSIKRLT